MDINQKPEIKFSKSEKFSSNYRLEGRNQFRETDKHIYNDCATDLNFSSALVNCSHLDLHLEIQQLFLEKSLSTLCK